MGLFSSLVAIVGHLALLMLDLTILFILVRLAVRWKRFRLLVPFDTIGRPLVATIMQVVDRWQKALQPSGIMTVDQILVIAVAGLAALRMCLTSLLGTLR